MPRSNYIENDSRHASLFNYTKFLNKWDNFNTIGNFFTLTNKILTQTINLIAILSTIHFNS